MNQKELKEKMETIKNRGFFPSLRKGDTGIGYTFESEMGLQETNIAIPDIGGRFEIKTTRKKSANLITLFTFNKAVWKVSQKDVIDRFGYKDEKGRPALYNTVFNNQNNSSNLSIGIDRIKNTISLYETDTCLAEWDLFVLVGKFSTKLSRVLLVIAESEMRENREHFFYNEAYLLLEPETRKFIEAFERSLVGIDIRMHLKENGAVRNHGTGFRCREYDLKNLYQKVVRIL
ncbi:MAG: hypothetical protein A2Y33_14555 [Spirochaetes bacterium GWF1_51_8]|nr:MAG: hypothetical protein A2Y33_14555 [Spirochaetes bacterium GWF1_51_8]